MEYVKKETQIDREIEAAKEINRRLKKKKELAEIELENKRLRKEILAIQNDDGSTPQVNSPYTSPYTSPFIYKSDYWNENIIHCDCSS